MPLRDKSHTYPCQPSGRECYPLTRSEHLDVLAFRPYTLQPNIGNVLAS